MDRKELNMGNIIILLALLFLYLLIQSKISNTNQTGQDKEKEQNNEDKKKKKPLFSETIGIFEGIKEGYSDAKKIIRDAELDNNSEEEPENFKHPDNYKLTVIFDGEEDKDLIDSLNEITDVSEYIKKLVRKDLNK